MSAAGPVGRGRVVVTAGGLVVVAVADCAPLELLEHAAPSSAAHVNIAAARRLVTS
jgi:hypothetical protein